MPIDLSAADWCFWRDGRSAEDYYRALRAAGVGAAEMVPAARRAACRAAGLAIATLSAPGMRKGLNCREHHAELLPQIEAAIAEAGREGVPGLIVFSGDRAGQAHKDGVAACAEALRHLAARAEAAGVTLLFELLNSWDHVDYAGDHLPYCLAVIEAVASPRLRVLYDCYHAARMGADLAGDLRRHAQAIGHIHVAEPPTRRRPLAGSALAWRRLVEAADAGGYRGRWGLEFIADGEPLDEVRDAAALFAGAAP